MIPSAGHAGKTSQLKCDLQASELNAQSNTQTSEDMEPFFHFSESAPPNLEEVYKASLSDLQFGHFDAAVPGAYNRYQ